MTPPMKRGRGTEDPADATQFLLTIPIDKIGGIIGPGGATIKSLQERTGCTINVEKRTGHFTPVKLVALEGSVDAKCNAVKGIMEIIHKDSSGPHQLGFMIPPSANSLVIGTGGRQVKELQKETGADIQFSRDPNSPGLCEVTGTSEQIADAARRIYRIASTDNAALSGRPPPPQRGGMTGIASVGGAANTNIAGINPSAIGPLLQAFQQMQTMQGQQPHGNMGVFGGGMKPQFGTAGGSALQHGGGANGFGNGANGFGNGANGFGNGANGFGGGGYGGAHFGGVGNGRQLGQPISTMLAQSPGGIGGYGGGMGLGGGIRQPSFGKPVVFGTKRQ